MSCVVLVPTVIGLTVRHAANDQRYLTHTFPLTDKDRIPTDQKCARTEQERSRAKVLTEMGVTPPETTLLNLIYHGAASPLYLPINATSRYYSLAGPVTQEEGRFALAACLGKGWLQVIDEVALAKIAGELREGRVLGPINGLPQIGDVDFTPAGAELWYRLSRRCFPNPGPPSDFTDVVHCKFTRYFSIKAAAFADMAEVGRQIDVVSVTGPQPIGPWRLQWWRRFPQGYRIDFEERSQWRCRRPVGEGSYMAHSHKASDPQRLLHLLDCHNVTLREWLVMAALDHGPRDKLVSCLPRWAAESGQTYFGVIASEEECRTGLEACLRYGWLRIMDQHAIEEVHAFLRDDPVLVPRPSAVVAGQGELDFTPCGAMPYRMIAAEWPCPYWEDNICVWKESYREEHRYCEAKEVLQGIVQQYAAGAEVVRASRVVPIGPWCVYWWQQFPAGYRLELEIGDL